MSLLSKIDKRYLYFKKKKWISHSHGVLSEKHARYKLAQTLKTLLH